MPIKARRPLKLPTPERLANIALHYLGRYAASEASLRRVLRNRLRRATMRDPAFAADTERQKQLHNAIETIIEKHRKLGILNDASYAAMKHDSLRRQGRSSRAIHQKLLIKGIDKRLIEETLKPYEEDHSERELGAAHKLAKRKKLGPYAVGAIDNAKHTKHIAIMARAGFTFDTIKKVLGGEIPEDFSD
ncbi:MAG: regulatory protein RecX [Alphaproteobacteria bacterium]